MTVYIYIYTVHEAAISAEPGITLTTTERESCNFEQFSYIIIRNGGYIIIIIYRARIHF